MNNKITETLQIPLSFEAHKIAKKLAQGITNPTQSRQVYLNALAVYATDFHLRCLQFATDWSKSEHQDSLIRSLFDLADLEIDNIGKIECRPLLAESNVMRIPVETWEDRVAYVAVELNANLKEAKILGFTQTPQEEIPVENLESFDNFLDYLCELEVQETETNSISQAITNLGEWFNGIIDDGWQSVDLILNPSQLDFARAREFNVSRGRKIDLVFPLKTIQVGLITKLTVDSEKEEDFPTEEESQIGEEIDILIELHPIEESYLPEGIILGIEDDGGNMVLQAQARDEENWIQLAFSAEFGEKFKAVIILDDCQAKQEFIV